MPRTTRMTASCGNGAFDKDADFLKERNPPSQSKSECSDPPRQALALDLKGTSITP